MHRFISLQSHFWFWQRIILTVSHVGYITLNLAKSCVCGTVSVVKLNIIHVGHKWVSGAITMCWHWRVVQEVQPWRGKCGNNTCNSVQRYHYCTLHPFFPYNAIVPSYCKYDSCNMFIHSDKVVKFEYSCNEWFCIYVGWSGCWWCWSSSKIC